MKVVVVTIDGVLDADVGIPIHAPHILVSKIRWRCAQEYSKPVHIGDLAIMDSGYHPAIMDNDYFVQALDR